MLSPAVSPAVKLITDQHCLQQLLSLQGRCQASMALQGASETQDYGVMRSFEAQEVLNSSSCIKQGHQCSLERAVHLPGWSLCHCRSALKETNLEPRGFGVALLRGGGSVGSVVPVLRAGSRVGAGLLPLPGHTPLLQPQEAPGCARAAGSCSPERGSRAR